MVKQYFDLKVGFTCNNNCIHCVIAEKRGIDLTTQELKDIIDGLKGPHVVGFTGGEATIRPDFLELLKYSKDRGHDTALQTNGVMFSDLAFTKSVALYLDTVLIAIHSSNSKIHDAIVRSKGMSKKTLKGFDNILATGIPCSTQTVISKLNVNSLEETYDYIQSKAPGIGMSCTSPHPQGNAYDPTILVQFKDMAEILYRVYEKWGPYIRTEAIPICYIYPYENIINLNFDDVILKNIDPRHGLDPANKCNELDGFFDKDGKTEQYNELSLSEKRKGPKCKSCIFDAHCVGVWKEYMEFFSQYLDLYPITPNSEKNGSLIIYGYEKCLNTCLFCPGMSAPMSEVAKYEKAIKEIDYFASNGNEQIDISGGDPGEYQRLPAIIAYIRKSKMFANLSTHGRTLKNWEFAQALFYAGLNTVKIPLYGSYPELHDKCVGSDGAFFDTLAGLRNMAKLNMPVLASVAVNKYNQHDIENIIDLFLSIPKINIQILMVSITFIGSVSEEYTADWYLPIKDMKEMARKAHDKFKEIKDGTKTILIDVPYCVLGEYTEHIQNTGHVISMGMGQIGESSKSSVPGVPHYRLKTYFDECDKCSLKNNKCAGIPINDLKMFGTEGLKAIV